MTFSWISTWEPVGRDIIETEYTGYSKSQLDGIFAVMMVLCRKCSRVLPTDGLHATCGGCSGTYHLTSECSVTERTWNGKSEKKRLSWRCSVCRSAREENIPDDESYDGSRRGSERDLGTSDRILTSEIDELRAVIADLREGLGGWRAEAERREREHGETIKRLEDKINILIARSEEKDKYIECLEERVNELEKHIYEKNIEVLGIPEGELKDEEKNQFKEKLSTILQTYNVNLSPVDIEEAYKVKNHKQHTKSIVVVKLKEKYKKIAILRKYKDDVRGGKKGQIRLFEQISKAQKALLWEARDRAKNMQWAFVWVQNGNILARKGDGDTITKIGSRRDLSKIANV